MQKENLKSNSTKERQEIIKQRQQNKESKWDKSKQKILKETGTKIRKK